MSNLKKRSVASPMETALNALSSGIAKQRGQLVNVDNARIVSAGMESGSQAEILQRQNKFSSIENALQEMLGQSSALVTSHGLEAAAIALGGTGNAVEYNRSARNAARPTGAPIFGNLRSGMGGEIAYSTGLESFDTQEINKSAQISVAYNLAAPRQDEVGELWYPIIIATPDQAFYEVVVRRPTVYNGVTHADTGEVSKFNKHNLMDAFRDHTILKNETTRLIPYANDKTAAKLAPEAEVGTTLFEVSEGIKVPTRPLVIGTEVNLMGISSHPDLVANGLFTQQTQIDRNVRVTRVYVEVANADGSEKAILSFETAHMPTNQFYKTTEGMGYDGMLRFRPKAIIIDSKTKAHNQTAAAPLAAFVANNLTAVFEMALDGDIQYEQGTVDVRGGKFAVRVLKDATGAEVALAGSGLEDLKFTVKYYELEARITNSDKKVRGLLLDSDLWREIYEVPLLSPLVTQFPINDEKHELLTVETLVDATHLLLANTCITTMFNYAEHLDAFYRANLNNLRAASIEGEGIEGVGRLLVTPFFEELEIDLLKVVNSVKSSDKMADIGGFFRTQLNELAYRAAQKSGYIPVLRQQTKNPSAKPTLLIATDQILPAFMQLTGDDRFSGIKMDHKVASSPDHRMEGQIFMSFGGLDGEFNPLNSGNLIYIPELVSTIQMPRNGGVVMESMVQPRFRHVNNLPVMVRVTVTNLDAIASTRTRIDVNQYTPTP